MQKSSKIKIILSGASGQVGHAIQQVFSKEKQIELQAFDSSQLDIRNAKRIKEICEAFKPDYFINTAAYTKVDLAETESELAFSINRDAMASICKVCNHLNMHLIHFSSDYVYDSIFGRPLLETDLCDPKSVYAKSKLQGDNYIALNCNSYSIFRTSWVYGPNGKNFVNTMLHLAQKNEFLKIVNDQIGTPTYTLDLAQAVFKLIQYSFPDKGDAFSGLYHFSNSGETNWANFADKIFDIKNIDMGIKIV